MEEVTCSLRRREELAKQKHRPGFSSSVQVLAHLGAPSAQIVPPDPFSLSPGFTDGGLLSPLGQSPWTARLLARNQEEKSVSWSLSAASGTGRWSQNASA